MCIVVCHAESYFVLFFLCVKLDWVAKTKYPARKSLSAFVTSLYVIGEMEAELKEMELLMSEILSSIREILPKVIFIIIVDSIRQKALAVTKTRTGLRLE